MKQIKHAAIQKTQKIPPQNTEIKQSILKVWTGCSIPKHILQLKGGRDTKELKTLHKKNIFFSFQRKLSSRMTFKTLECLAL